MQKRIILASASGGRKKLLEELGIKFEVIPSEYEEDHSLQMNPHEFVKFLATLKARDVASRVESAFVIGADTMVLFEKEIIGKPKNAKEASQTLQKLQGRTHKVITGYAVFDTDKDKLLVRYNKEYESFLEIIDLFKDKLSKEFTPISSIELFSESIKNKPELWV